MSDYTPTIDFGRKDNLTTGHPDKLVKGTEIDRELGAVSEAIKSKSEGTGDAVVTTIALFTPTYGTGFSSDPSGSMRYQIMSDGGTHGIVTITDDNDAAFVGTSDTTAFSITGIPSVIRPDATIISNISMAYQDNSVIALGFASITAAGVMTFYKMGASAFSATGWTGSNSKGFDQGWKVMYPLIITA